MKITLTDRCDRCGHAAAFGFQKWLPSPHPARPLIVMLCGHHTREHHDALSAQGFRMAGTTSADFERESIPA
jgi:hypothetical protein